MRSIESTAGEYLVDNRNSPGVPEAVVVAIGLPAKAARGLYEEACYTCSHCQQVVVKNRERTRPRGFCKKCNHVLCDACDAEYHRSGHVCYPYKDFVEDLRNQAIIAAQAAKEF